MTTYRVTFRLPRNYRTLTQEFTAASDDAARGYVAHMNVPAEGASIHILDRQTVTDKGKAYWTGIPRDAERLERRRNKQLNKKANTQPTGKLTKRLGVTGRKRKNRSRGDPTAPPEHAHRHALEELERARWQANLFSSFVQQRDLSD